VEDIAQLFQTSMTLTEAHYLKFLERLHNEAIWCSPVDVSKTIAGLANSTFFSSL
jgi:hypothetical protein